MFRAFRVVADGLEGYRSEIRNLTPSDLPAGDVTIRVIYSSLNYKDALSATGYPGITSSYPHTPGCDAAGYVESSLDPRWKVGQKVIVTGYDLGMNTHGGFSELIRVPSDWIVELPSRLTLKESMILGTAGFTAALGIQVLLKFSQTRPGDTVVITGASGGVGSLASGIFSQLGWKVLACTSKSGSHDFLYSLGVDQVIAREEFLLGQSKSLDHAIYHGMIDTVGGDSLNRGLSQCRPHSVVACCGMITSALFNSSLMPFLLRGIRLIGLSAAQTPMVIRKDIWNNLSADWKPKTLDYLVRIVGLDSLAEAINQMLLGASMGRVIVQLGEEH